MLLLIVLTGIGVSLGMAGAWVIQRLTKNASWVDACWTFATGIAGVALALGAGAAGFRHFVVAALIGVWSLRLGLYIARRAAGGPEDVRYAHFRTEWGADFERRMFWFLQIQASVAYLLALCVLLAACNPARDVRVTDAAAIVVVLVAIAGAGMADLQLRRFRADPANRGRVCDAGLWGWSRHPNYFFEFLGWCAYPLFAINLDGTYLWGWLALVAPALMYWTLVYASGIPPTEERMLASRGDAYRAYQARTSAFFPRPPGRRSAA